MSRYGPSLAFGPGEGGGMRCAEDGGFCCAVRCFAADHQNRPMQSSVSRAIQIGRDREDGRKGGK